MSCNGSISARTSKSSSCAVYENVRCDEESVPPFSLAVGHDSLTHTEETHNSESSSDRSQVEDQLTCSHFAASTNGSQTRNRTHGEGSDVGGVPETSKSHGDDVEDETVENVLVFDTGLETPCVGHWMIIVCILLRWYCRPMNLEKRPRYLRTRSELEALDTKPEVYRVSRNLRRCVALAAIRKRFRAWRIDTKNEKNDRIGRVVGVAFLLIVMFQPVAEGSAVVPVTSTSTNVTQHRNETALANATNVHTDMNQLAALNVDPGLKEFIGTLVMGFQSELRELKRENVELNSMIEALQSANVELKKEDTALQNRTQVIEVELVRVKNKTEILEIDNKAVRAELQQAKKDKDTFENKTRVIQKENAALHAELSKVLIVVTKLQNQTTTNSVRLDQCEADTHPFIKEMQASQRRRLQEEETLCRGSGLNAMFQACCPSGSAGNGHRILQLIEGCDTLPETCSASCAPLFIEYFEGCQEIIDDLAPDQRQIFVGFYGGCQEVEQAAAAMLEDARPAMIFHVVVMSEAEAQQAQMFGGGSSPAPPVGPIGPLLPPSPSPAGGAEIAQEFRRVCTTANLTICVPQCNRLTYGFLLSIEIDGRGTVMTCNVMDMLYAWVGQASLGGYIGEVFAAFFSSVISGALGTYMVKMTGSQNVHTDLTIEPGQVVVINGDMALPQPPIWGSGGFTVGESASLSLSYMQIDTVIRTNEGASQLMLDSCELTFTDTLVLRTATATFLSQVFQGGIEVPHGADVSIDSSSLTFAASANTGLTVRSRSAVSVSSTTLGKERDATVVVSVEEGGGFVVSGSHLIDAAGDTEMFSWPDDMPVCDCGNHGGADGPCMSPVGDCLCEAHGLVDGHRYPNPWSGSRCEVRPATDRECCSTHNGGTCTRGTRPGMYKCCEVGSACAALESRDIVGCCSSGCCQMTCGGGNCRGYACDMTC
eukprot:SAG11_NODE_64_length_18817_cov_64.238327_7_plen_938_part_00